MPSKNLSPVTQAAFLALAVLGITGAQASVIVHAEAQVSNIQITPSAGNLDWYFDPWLTVAGTGTFDDLSGWDQAYDDDFDLDGEATAAAATPYLDATASASANAFTIGAEINVNDPAGDLSAFSGYSFGELYNVFEITEPNPVEVTFSLDYSALIEASATVVGLDYEVDYGIVMEISDGLTDWILDTSYLLSGTGIQNHSDSGTLALTIDNLIPSTPYSVSIIVDPNTRERVLEPSSLSLLGLGLVGLRVLRRRPIHRASTAG